MSMVQTKKLQSAIKYQIANNKLSPGLVSHNSDIMGLCHTILDGKQKKAKIFSKKNQKYSDICNKIGSNGVAMDENVHKFAS